MDKYFTLENNIDQLYSKITEYELLYKKWCKKVDLIIKSIIIKINTLEIEQLKKINNLESKLINEIDKLELTIGKQNKIIIFLVNKTKKLSNNSFYKYIFILISLQLILFFILIYYINATII